MAFKKQPRRTSPHQNLLKVLRNNELQGTYRGRRVTPSYPVARQTYSGILTARAEVPRLDVHEVAPT